jgi:hypothetical protein
MSGSVLDFAWRTAFRVGFRLARIWWRLTRPRREGVAAAVYVGSELLLVRPRTGLGGIYPAERKWSWRISRSSFLRR